MQDKNTQAPTVNHNRCGWSLTWADGFVSAMPSEDSAKLLAAAPDLLEACKDALGAMVAEYGSNPPPFVSATFDNLRAAIAKVEGP